MQFLFSDESAKYGAIISLEGGHLRPLPFETMINPENSPDEICARWTWTARATAARAYMIRLEKRDVEEPARLGRIAEAANLTPEQFRQCFAAVATDG